MAVWAVKSQARDGTVEHTGEGHNSLGEAKRIAREMALVHRNTTFFVEKTTGAFRVAAVYHYAKTV